MSNHRAKSFARSRDVPWWRGCDLSTIIIEYSKVLVDTPKSRLRALERRWWGAHLPGWRPRIGHFILTPTDCKVIRSRVWSGRNNSHSRWHKAIAARSQAPVSDSSPGTGAAGFRSHYSRQGREHPQRRFQGSEPYSRSCYGRAKFGPREGCR